VIAVNGAGLGSKSLGIIFQMFHSKTYVLYVDYSCGLAFIFVPLST
jgi:hypothetical protein